MLIGGTSVLAAAFHPREVWDEMRSCGAVGFAGAGAMVSMLWNLPPDPRRRRGPSSLHLGVAHRGRHVPRDRGALSLPRGDDVRHDRGVSDCLQGRLRPRQTGYLWTGYAFDVRIVDPEGSLLPRGAVEEITCWARTMHAMSEGYVSSASSGRGLIIDPHPECFGTGDLGILDDDGNLTFVTGSRTRCVGAGKISPPRKPSRWSCAIRRCWRAPQSVYQPISASRTSFVIVTLRPGAALEYAEPLDFCADRMPYFCVPRYLEVLDEMPKNAIGRVRKDALRSRGLGVRAWDREAHGYVLSR
jgi:crotonobetaine/carnitine-CoA ligase